MDNNQNKGKKEEIDFSIYLENLEEPKAKNSDKKPKMEDISSSSKKMPLKKRFYIWLHRKDNKGQKAAVIIAAIILLIVIIVGGFLWAKLSLIDTDGEDDFSATEDLEDDISIEEMDSITNAASLNDLLMKWATNGGEKMHSKNVKNVLLIGKDSESNLADSMILVSVNEKDKKISLVSFYRDSYTYIKPEGKKPGFAKMNAAYSRGGAKCLIETIENNYKIKIDDYVMVDYNSFPKVIDALGGVNVNVTEREANFLNRTWKDWSLTGNKVTYKTGINKLDGERALMFCRIRKLDSDIGRTERQRRVITSIMNSFKDASLSKMNNAVNVLLPNVKTGMSKTEILGYAADAISSGWLGYPMAQTPMPTEDTSRGGYIGDQWVWIVDYEGAAYQLQMLLYGKSNIEMSDDRISAIGIKPTTTQSVSRPPVSSESVTNVTPTKPTEPATETPTVPDTTEPETTSTPVTTDPAGGTGTGDTPSNEEIKNGLLDILDPLGVLVPRR